MQFSRTVNARNTNTAGFARASILGFACNQGFVFALFYLGLNRSVGNGAVVFERIELFGTLLFVVFAFTVLRAASHRARQALLAPPFLWCYAALLVIGSFLPLVIASTSMLALVTECLLIGIPFGLCLAAWGRVLGTEPVASSVPEVLIGSALGAAVCFTCAVVPFEWAVVVLKLLPFGSVAALGYLLSQRQIAVDVPEKMSTDKDTQLSDRPSLEPVDDTSQTIPAEFSVLRSALFASDRMTSQLSLKMIAGTAVFGLASGFMETYGSDPGMNTTPAFPVTLFIFVLFCMAALQLLTPEKAIESSDVPLREQGPLDSAYRLAILLMMAGFLFVPVLDGFGVPGEAIELAGYLGLSVVLVSLFLAMGRVLGADTELSFARGFSALYLGEMAGIALGNLVDICVSNGQTPYVVVACAGLAALFAYLFLFTERDFRALSMAVSEIDLFEEACIQIGKKAGLSKRESEILPLALKGRTGDRIAAELYISKSTVDTHLRRIYQKCGVHGRQELIDLGERTQHDLAQLP